MSSTLSDSSSLAAMNEALDEVKRDYAEIKDGDALFERIAGRLKSVYENPPLAECQQCIIASGDATLESDLTQEQLRDIMFCPDQSQVKYYPLFVGMEPGSSQGDAQQRAKAIFLTLLFLLHRKHVWFLTEFVLQGGMRSLTVLLADDNIYYRGQAVDTMLAVIDCDAYDWFATPLATPRDEALHQRLLDLLAPEPPPDASGAVAVPESPLIRNLCLNNSNEVLGGAGAAATKKPSESTFPGGSLKCLQLLGFFLSWCRRLYTPTQVLVLSAPVIQELNAWRRSALAESTEVCEELTPEASAAEELDAAERKFAQELYSDFVHSQFGEEQPLSGADHVDYGRFCVFEVDRSIRPTRVYSSHADRADAGAGAGAGSSSSSSSASVPAPVPVPKVAAAAVEPADASLLDPLPVPGSAADFKEVGNRLFLRGDYDAALAHYSGGVLLLRRQCADGGPGVFILGGADLELLVSLLHNAATVLWKVFKAAEEGLGGLAAAKRAAESRRRWVGCWDAAAVGIQLSASGARVTLPTEASPAAAAEGGAREAPLLLCAALCRNILALTAGAHVKATYRLASALLKLGRPAEGVVLVDAYIQQQGQTMARGGAADDELADAMYTLRAVRRQCVSALMAAEEAAGAGRGAAEEARAASLVNPKVNTVLQALQARREKARAEAAAAAAATASSSSSSAAASAAVEFSAADAAAAPGRVSGSMFRFSASMAGIDGDDAGAGGMTMTAPATEPGVDFEGDMRRDCSSSMKVLQLSQDSKKDKKSKDRSKGTKEKEKAKAKGGVIIPGLESLGGLGKGGRSKGAKDRDPGALDLDALML